MYGSTIQQPHVLQISILLLLLPVTAMVEISPEQVSLWTQVICWM